MSREDQSLVTVIVDWPGLGDLGTWENRTGGAGTSDSTKHREGGMGPLRSYGGPPTMDNVVVARRYDYVAVHTRIKTLMNARGKATMYVVEQVLDEYGVVFGDPLTYTGKLIEVNQGDANANSSDIRMVELTQDTESIA